VRTIRRYVGIALVIYVLIKILGAVMEPVIPILISLLFLTLLISWALRFK
jgi:hypothetical protein